MTNSDDSQAPAEPALAAPRRLPRPGRPLWIYYPALLARRGNRVEGRGWAAAWLRLTTFFFGPSADNVVRVGRNFRTRGLAIVVSGAGNRVEIGDDVAFSGNIELRGFNLTVTIGDRCDAKKTRILASDANVRIGDDCLIAAGVHIRTSDMHAITDRVSGDRINPASDVVVGNAVWLAGEAALLKGARLPDGCVVGFRSVVTHSFDEPDSVLAGAPARVVRRGVAWTR
ncbi:acyltransferase [Methylobacterium haplocladii]|uniref:Acyltransferase n=1 Tax=Methylobacterium haplocladii TaxID=1176176 RepID=A0A512ISY0_9HYPH|nr:acyltransferase [Methylobacterium haplocladii]GEP00822.1 hypothetical protein MHA02_32090 [Methylobacterium haplocladii]GJD85204.1 UDP-3-O-(3-hydroxymyristoyl)glucosamine N-acyltransferase [Methylobacterium haplocladii]GLS59284.1 hypothetical protein GCM10007887_19500 [Methylobacterium haplocladii]